MAKEIENLKKELEGRVPMKGAWFMADWAQLIIQDQDPHYFFAYILLIIQYMNDI